MKKVKKFLLGNIKTVIAFFIGAIVFGSISAVVATGIAASSVDYTTTANNNVQNMGDALDDLYTIAVDVKQQYNTCTGNLSTCQTNLSTYINPNNNFGTPQYYAFGRYKGWCSSTDCNSYADFPTTSINPPSGENAYAVKYADGGYGICITRSGTPHCFRGRNFAYEAQHIQKVFSGANDSCSVSSSNVGCNGSGFYCNVSSDGYVNCLDYGTFTRCDLYGSGYVFCEYI